MTPTAPELLAACAAALGAQPQPEDGAVFTASRTRAATMILGLVAQECAAGASARLWENAALRALFQRTGASYGITGSDASDGDGSLAALDAANATLRRRLIRLHEAAEAAGDDELDRTILALYREMARRRELTLVPAKPGG
jgi:hypothetical protein